jgi:hypothetical protein
VVNTSLDEKQNVSVTIPAGQIVDAVTGEPIPRDHKGIRLDLYPCGLKTFHVQLD